MIRFLTKYGFTVFGLVVLAVSALGYGMVAGSATDEEQARSQEILALEQRHTAREQELHEESQQVYDNLLGTDHSRVTKDEVIIEKLLKAALTWDSHESYVAARENVIEEYQLSSEADFIETYLPPAPVTTDGAGNEYYGIDAAGLNSRFGSFETEVLSVIKTEYRYLVSVTAESVSNDELGSAANTSVVLVTINGNGKITDISGYAEDADFSRRSSGTGFDTAGAEVQGDQ